MLLSMTGYGRVTQSYKDKTISVEIRSLNSKYTDIRLKMPHNFRGKEPDIRRKVSEKAERGKIEVNIDFKSIHGDEDYNLNQKLFRKYYQELEKLGKELGVPQTDLMPAILRLPNVVSTQADEIKEEEWAAVLEVLNIAIEKFQKFRNDEGAAMEEDLRLRISNIRNLLSQVDPHEEARIGKLRQRMQQNLDEYLGKENVDENRFEQEVLFYLEKIDITEEKVRLEQHCTYFLEELEKEITLKGPQTQLHQSGNGPRDQYIGRKSLFFRYPTTGCWDER